MMNNKIVLSGDIIASTSLTDKEKSVLELELKKLISLLDKDYSIYGRIIKGDYIEMVVDNTHEALTIAIIIKCYIKSIFIDSKIETSRSKYFKNYGIRLALGYGELSRYDKVSEVIDGEAIYYSGRKISEERPTYNKERIVIKNTLFFNSGDEKLNDNINCILGLLDVLLNNATAKQCEILYLRLLGNSEKEIAAILNIKQPTVNKQLSSVGWNAIERATSYFKSTFLALRKIW